jgi:N-acetylglutamate synthase-like GNAT family acetyltransferase
MHLCSPKTKSEFEKYFELRWQILRKPWGQPKGSEQDSDEDNSYHLMAIENGRVIGIARLQFTKHNAAQLRYMAVDSAHQKKGIGKSLIEHLETYAKQHEVNELFLHARDNALIFYKKLGYEITEKSYLLFDSIQHYKMCKKL